MTSIKKNYNIADNLKDDSKAILKSLNIEDGAESDDPEIMEIEDSI